MENTFASRGAVVEDLDPTALSRCGSWHLIWHPIPFLAREKLLIGYPTP